jgi:hypothetical protein
MSSFIETSLIFSLFLGQTNLLNFIFYKYYKIIKNIKNGMKSDYTLLKIAKER